jgi:hypothetical protein
MPYNTYVCVIKTSYASPIWISLICKDITALTSSEIKKFTDFIKNKISDCGEINTVQYKDPDILYPCQALRCTDNLINRH